MVNSIQHFLEFGLRDLEDTVISFAQHPDKLAEYVYGVTDSVTKLGLSIIAEQLEAFDEKIRRSGTRKQNWVIVRRDETTLLTSLGPVHYRKTLFKNKATGKSSYLLDECMGLESHTRVTEDAVAKVLEEAVESSYRKGGEKACITEDIISKQAVMNKLHVLEFPPLPKSEELKRVSYLYIDADEDHVGLQFLDEKGEKLLPGQRRCAMPKLVYVYEGITDENGRNELVNAAYFGGMYEGSEGVAKLWKEVNSYIQSHYNEDDIKQIYINGDGAIWIKQGENYIPRSEFVLDKFHLHQYIIKATSHLGDEVKQARNDLYTAVARKDKNLVSKVFDAIATASSEESMAKVENCCNYILGNWNGITRQVRTKDSQVKCSAEGHVSHVFSDRMSSRPLGWSKLGVDKIARLRVYRENKGNMLDLVRYQKTEKAAGFEAYELSAGDIDADLSRQRQNLGYLYGTKLYTVPLKIAKIAGIRFNLSL